MKLAIFDFDGTLVDSRRNIQTAMGMAFLECGLTPPPYEQTRRIVGLALQEACSRLAPDLEPAALSKLIDAYKDAFAAMRRDPSHSEALYDGARETLDRLRGQGWLLAGATGKSRRGVESVLVGHDLARHFDVVRCADDGPGKPHPFMATACIDHVGVDARRAVVIGDTAFDMAMARAAGAAAYGVTWGFHTPEEIREGGAHLLVDDFAALESALDLFAREDSAEGAA